MSWYNASWTYRQKITTDAAVIDEAVPFMYVKLSELNMHFWDNTKSDLGDVRICSSDGSTEVALCIQGYDKSAMTGALFIDVSATISAASNVDFYVYYGNSGASAYSANATYGEQAVFAAYAGVYFPGMDTRDFTSGGRTLTAVNSPGTAASGYEGITAATYDGTSSYHHYSSTQAITNWPLTIESLLLTDVGTVTRVATGLSVNNSSTSFVTLLKNTSGTLTTTLQGNSGSAASVSMGSIGTATWHYAVVTRDSNASPGTTYGYLNATQSSSPTDVNSPLTFNRFGIGALLYSNSVSLFWDGNVAVVLLDDTDRTANYVTTQHQNWLGNLYNQGAIETETGGTTGWVLFQTAATTALGVDIDWTNVNNALSVNADAATAVVPTDEYTEYLNLTNPAYGITIPTSQTTYSVAMRLRRSNNTGSARAAEDETIKIILAGTRSGSNLADVGTPWGSVSNKTYSGSWGLTFAQSDFGSTFGLAVRALCTSSGPDITASVITAWMRVDWDTPGGGITGDGAVTLPHPLTLAASGGVLVAGSGGATLPHPLTLSGVGGVVVGGTGAITLPHPFVAAGAGGSLAGGTGAIGLPHPLVLAGAGTVLVGGTGAITLPHPMVLNGNADVVIAGSGNINLPVLDVSGETTPDSGTTGWLTFQTAYNHPVPGLGGITWLNPDNALDVGDDDYASLPTLSNGFVTPSDHLRLTNPVLTGLPDNCIITGMRFRIRVQGLNDTFGNPPYSLVQVIIGGSGTGNNLHYPLVGTGIVNGEYESELTPSRNQIDASFGIQRRVQSNNVGGEYRVYTAWVQFDYESIDAISGTGAIDLPSITASTPPQPTGGTSTITIPVLTMKGHTYNAPCACCEGYTMRTLIELRRMLAQQSGHLELVVDSENEDWSDNGADYFIQAGQRFCDDQFQYHKSEAWFYAKVAAGESLVTFKNARIIKEVWINSVGGQRALVKRQTLNSIRESYTEPLLSSQAQDVPSVWTPAILGLAPQQFEETALTFDAAGITDYDLIMFGNHYPYKGIYIMDPPDTDYTVEIKAEWYSHEMCEDEDVSFWSQYPELILMAARRQMEIDIHRNSTGAQDFEAPLLRSLQKLYHNLVAEESSGPTKVRNG